MSRLLISHGSRYSFKRFYKHSPNNPRKSFTTHELPDLQEPEGPKKKEMNLINPSIEPRIFRLEDNLIQMSKNIADIKGEAGTINWQLKIILGILLTGSGSVLIYFLKDALDNIMALRKQSLGKDREK